MRSNWKTLLALILSVSLALSLTAIAFADMDEVGEEVTVAEARSEAAEDAYVGTEHISETKSAANDTEVEEEIHETRETAPVTESAGNDSDEEEIPDTPKTQESEPAAEVEETATPYVETAASETGDNGNSSAQASDTAVFDNEVTDPVSDLPQVTVDETEVATDEVAQGETVESSYTETEVPAESTDAEVVGGTEETPAFEVKEKEVANTSKEKEVVAENSVTEEKEVTGTETSGAEVEAAPEEVSEILEDTSVVEETAGSEGEITAAAAADEVQPFYIDPTISNCGISTNYTVYLPEPLVYTLSGTDLVKQGVSINFGDKYVPGEATINFKKIDGVRIGGQDVGVIYEYFDPYPQYDGRAHNWDGKYRKSGDYNKSNLKLSKGKGGNDSESGAVQVYAELIKLSDNGMPTWKASDWIDDGVRVQKVAFKYNIYATMSGNGDWLEDDYPYNNNKRPNLKITLKIQNGKAGLSKTDVKVIKEFMKRSDMALDFGILRRPIAQNGGQYDKLDIKKSGNSFKVKGVKMRIRFRDADNDNKYFDKYLSLTEYKVRNSGKSKGAYKVLEISPEAIVIEGKRNFEGKAVWIKESPDGTFSLQ